MGLVVTTIVEADASGNVPTGPGIPSKSLLAKMAWRLTCWDVHSQLPAGAVHH